MESKAGGSGGGGPGGGKTASTGLNQAFLAMSRFRRRKFDSCIDLCTQELAANPRDEAMWVLKIRALTQNAYIDDMDLEEEGVADLILDDSAVSKAPRPGTSLKKPGTSAGAVPFSAGSGSMRPLTTSGRPVSGYARPGSQSGRGGGGGAGDVESAFKGSRPGTARPVSVAGRFVRLGTASMVNDPNGPFINLDRFNFAHTVARPAVAKALMDYILYHEHNPKRALDLGAEATKASQFGDWWWKARLGKAYYQLGMLREAEQQFNSAIRNQDMIASYLELAKVYLKLDQPNTALDIYNKGVDKFNDMSLLVGIARVHDQLNQWDKSIGFYKRVLQYEPTHVEAVACLASHYFYSDQPEVALRFYRRLLQMNVNNTEVWNNMGLCCFYASQYDIALGCFEKALALATDDNMADVWYNVGQIGIGLGDVNLAFQAFKVAISVDHNHAESYNNLGILELRKQNYEAARAYFQVRA